MFQSALLVNMMAQMSVAAWKLPLGLRVTERQK
jgi:hypothetical protein